MVALATALEVIQKVIRDSGDRCSIELRTVPQAPSLQRRSNGSVDLAALETAKVLSHEEGIPFWHSVLRLGSQTPLGVSPAVLQAALYSQPTTHLGFLACDSTLLDKAATLISDAPEGHTVTVMSRLHREGAATHMKMLDFSVKERWPGAEATAINTLQAMGETGTLLRSGRSYHFISDQLASQEDYNHFLYKCLLFTPIVDERWIAHQLTAGESALRVSPNAQGVSPIAIAYVR